MIGPLYIPINIVSISTVYYLSLLSLLSAKYLIQEININI